MRYAIYFAPPIDSILWTAGCQWLGRDPLRMRSLDQPDVPGIDAALLSEATTRPRRYGFHATLKPPFELGAGETEEALFAALTDFACNRKTILLPPLEIGNLRGFLALRTSQPCADLNKLADDCVSQFDCFRRQPTRQELKRRGQGLDARQAVLLQRWGYPHVMDQWRFHITLTGSVDGPQAEAIKAFLVDWFDAALRKPIRVGELCLFIEQKAGSEFQLRERFPLARSA